MPTLREAYARLRDLANETRQVQATIDRLTLDPNVFDHYEGVNEFGDREDHIASHANLPTDEHGVSEPELYAVFNCRQWHVDDNLNGNVYFGNADNFSDAKQQVIDAMADYCMKKEKP